ncbi:MAG: hypothetical protein V1913_01790 [Fibrobacterota bacterium]
MRPIAHAAASLVLAGGVYAATRSPALTALNFVCGVFIDIDHLPEFMIHHRFTQGPHRIFESEMHVEAERTVLFFHGYDLALLLSLGLVLTGFTGAALSVGSAMVVHLLMDQYYNPIKTPWAFFLIYRALKGFRTDAVYHRFSTKEWQEKRRAL